MDRKINLNVSFFTTLRAKRAILILFQNPTFKKHSCNFDHFWRKNSNNGNISDTNIKIVFLAFFPWNSNETFWGIFKHCGNPDWNTVKNYYHRWGEMQFLWFSFFILLQEAAQNDMWYWWYHRYKRWQAGIQSLSLSPSLKCKQNWKMHFNYHLQHVNIPLDF